MTTYKKTQDSDISGMETVKYKVRDAVIHGLVGALFAGGGLLIIDHFAISANASAITETNIRIGEVEQRIDQKLTKIEQSQEKLLNLHITGQIR